MSRANSRWQDLAYGLAMVLFFGLYVPLAKRWLTGATPLVASGLLYGSAGLSLLAVCLLRHAVGHRSVLERRLRLADARIYVFGACCGVAASALQLFGLRHVSGTAGSLLSNLEGVFTLGIALLMGDFLGLMESAGALAILAGAIVLSLGTHGGPTTQIVGIGAISLACLGWAVDNTTTQRLAQRDPFALMAAKCLLAGTVSLALAALTGSPLPSMGQAAAAVMIGAIWWAGGMLCFVMGMRQLGAARIGSMLSLTPFAGALGAIVGLGEPITPWVVGAGSLMAVGALALARGHLDSATGKPVIATPPTPLPEG